MPNAGRRVNQQSPFKRRPVELKEGLARRLSSYASAAGGAIRDALAAPVGGGWVVAGVAGVGMLALSTPAQADIVPGNSFSVFFGTHFWDVDGNGVADFIGFAVSAGHNGLAFALGSIRGTSGAGLLAGPLGAGYKVGPGDPFGGSGAFAAAFFTYTNTQMTRRSTRGSWANKSGYLGFVFDISGQAHYGWAYLSVSVGTAGIPGYSAVAGPVYYNTIPNQPIFTGETTSTPEPGTLGLLALGALGLGFWRRMKVVPAR
jgi:hypothetical protein